MAAKRSGLARATPEVWPALPLEEWQDTYETLHMWTQIVGKIRLAQEPLINHWWQVTLYVTSRGLTTLPISDGQRIFQIDFDFIDHHLRISSSDGGIRSIPLVPRSVADFYQEVMSALASLGLKVRIWTTPVEVANPIPFERDTYHASYDAEYAQRFWLILAQTNRVFKEFRARFIGKVSPVHFFWGSFDLAVSRFSGRRAPEHASTPLVADFVVREAYSHEVSSCGFWPGGGPIPSPAFYAYTYPEPAGFRDEPVRPKEAFFSRDFGEFILLYDDVRKAPNPDEMLLDFVQSTYEAAASLAGWDRAALERPVLRPTKSQGKSGLR